MIGVWTRPAPPSEPPNHGPPPGCDSATIQVFLGQVGAIGRVTLHGDESGFCVLRIKTYGHCGLVAMMGHAAIRSAGVWVTIDWH